MLKRSKCCIIGIPDHQGIFHVGGRLGAREGPKAFRTLFTKMTYTHLVSSNSIRDFGDVPQLGSDVANNHEKVSSFINHHLSPESLSVIIGGGHDHGFSHLRGISMVHAKKGIPPRLGCINIDAHLDVRKPSPEITSGSPFYLSLESGLLDSSRLIEFGIQSHCNAKQGVDYINEQGVKVVPFQNLRNGKAVPVFKKLLKNLALQCDIIVISLDLDALSSAYSPGVSAPQAEGFTAMEIIEMMEIAGREKKTVSLGIFELNPLYDIGQQSARLAATAACHFFDHSRNP